MSAPPLVVAMKVVEEGHTRFRIWFPLVLLLPLFLALLVLALVLAALADLFYLFGGRRPHYTRLVVGGVTVLHASRGTELHIEDKKRTVAMTLR